MRQRLQREVASSRYQLARLFLFGIGVLFAGRLFIIQVSQHDYYKGRADTSHQKTIEITPPRGQIYALDGKKIIPLVLNQTLKKIIADPRFVEDSATTAQTIALITGAEPKKYQELLDKDTAYVVLEQTLDLQRAAQIEEKELAGIALRETSKRIYPEGNLASHLLGFVNAEGSGQYGIEQYLDTELKGQPGLLTGAFDVRGIPIAVAENIQIESLPAEEFILTIDRNIQRQAEKALAGSIKQSKAKSGSVLIMDPNNGQVKALAAFPSYSPAEFGSTQNLSNFTNTAISAPFEPGSVMKVFSMALGLDLGRITPDTTYFDKSYTEVDDYTIHNAGAVVSKSRTMTEVITRSVNTGVIYVLKHLSGDGEKIDAEDKKLLSDFYTKKLHFGSHTNIELAGEQPGVVGVPTDSDVRFANMSFGQGMSTNMAQLGAALSSLINGGNYYQPTVIQATLDTNGRQTPRKPTLLNSGVVSQKTSDQIKAMMQTVVESGGGYIARRNGFNIGGKTGTAQIPNPEGGYYEDRELGSFFGFGPVEDPRYVIVVRVDEPKVPGFAGTVGAAPVFANLSNWLLDYYGITPSNKVN